MRSILRCILTPPPRWFFPRQRRLSPPRTSCSRSPRRSRPPIPTTPTTRLSQAMAKSFYEGLYGFDKDMKMIPVLAESYDREQGRPCLHDQAQEGHQVPRRHRLQGRRGEGQLRSRYQSGQQAQALRPLQQHREDRSRRRLHGEDHAEDAVLGVHQPARAPGRRDDQPDCAREIRQGHRVEPGRNGAVQVRRVEADRLPEGRQKFDGYWKKGYPKVDSINLEAGGRQQHARRRDANRRSAVHVPGALRAADALKARPDLEVVAAPSIILRYSVDEHASKSRSTIPRCARRSPTRSTRRRSPRLRSTDMRRRPKASSRRASNTTSTSVPGPTTSRRRKS